eukprot:TRINITY_DN128_c0_g1_i4.p1 TRINITY_DN128_c0_g1~~TRINITY_DN128_c0_g1_i4.p1  ORF type:complete len:114 (+),score=14.91 TRINITY_DN128_c0_g1_i4:31-342(+)
MAKGSMSQASQSVPRGAGGSAPRTAPPGVVARGSSAAGLRRRRTSGSSSGGGGFGGGNMLRFYTDDAPGLKITPTVVLVMSLCFIAFVTFLHVVGKLYGHKSS